ncbi:hypothetical protein LCGC14_0375810 [marine sediment metagenome]|uniref:Uncharacterized protein n=1 Tax=marine sediment metagenome TaxID=412755 RepID=A0A0F9WCG2_9ZZZZ
MKVILSTLDIVKLGNDGVWEYLRGKGMDMDKPIFGYHCSASNTAYGFAYEGQRKTLSKTGTK